LLAFVKRPPAYLAGAQAILLSYCASRAHEEQAEFLSNLH
jgi:hypothetical protein